MAPFKAAPHIQCLLGTRVLLSTAVLLCRKGDSPIPCLTTNQAGLPGHPHCLAPWHMPLNPIQGLLSSLAK